MTEARVGGAGTRPALPAPGFEGLPPDLQEALRPLPDWYLREINSFLSDLPGWRNLPRTELERLLCEFLLILAQGAVRQCEIIEARLPAIVQAAEDTIRRNEQAVSSIRPRFKTQPAKIAKEEARIAKRRARVRRLRARFPIDGVGELRKDYLATFGPVRPRRDGGHGPHV